MKRKSISERRIDDRISHAFSKACSGIQIPMLKIPAIWKIGRALIDAGVDDATLQQGLFKACQAVRVDA